jgi:hypothetical protein
VGDDEATNWDLRRSSDRSASNKIDCYGCTTDYANYKSPKSALSLSAAGRTLHRSQKSAKAQAWRSLRSARQFPLSPQRKTAPRARPARRKMTSSRQVSWLAGHGPSPPSQALMHKAQWQPEEGLAADSCGGSSGFDSPPQWRIAPNSLLGRSTRPAHLKTTDGRSPRRFCQRPEFISL